MGFYCKKTLLQNPTKIPISRDYIVTQFLVTQVSLLCYTFPPLEELSPEVQQSLG